MHGEQEIKELGAFMDNPDWWKSVKEANVVRPKRALPAASDCSPVDVDKIAAALSPGGAMQKTFTRYEPRAGQVDMARAVTHALNGNSCLMIEAGTGVGKSLAYLVPALHWAWHNDTPVIVSTATRNLQSQLVSQDIPRALATMPPDAAPKTAALKGRRNYLCMRMAGEYFAPGIFALDADERAEAAAFIKWLKTTEDGDLDDLAAKAPISTETLSSLSCTADECAGRRCRFYSRCFVMKARAAAARAHIVVTNHALVLAEAAGGGAGSILPAYGRIIFDEAHNLCDIATDALSFLFSRATFSRLSGRLLRMRGRGAHRRETGVLNDVENLMARGALSGKTDTRKLDEYCARARFALQKSAEACDSLCTAVAAFLSPSGAAGARQLRYRVADGTEVFRKNAPHKVRRQYNVNGLFADYTRADLDESAVTGAESAFETAMASLLDALSAIAKTLESSGSGAQAEELAAKTSGAAEAVREFIIETKFTLSASDPDYVYWIYRLERPGQPQSMQRNRKLPAPVALAAAPLSVAGKLDKLFFSSKDTTVLCSATLRTGASFSYMAHRLGFDLADPARAKSLVAASPFDYPAQAAAYNTAFMCNPAESAGPYTENLARMVVDLAAITRGRMLVLFTSYEMLNATASAAAGPLRDRGFRLVAQGGGLSRERMAAMLRQCGEPTVLFGAQSFWEGVDIPGDALSCVVIARLPFPQAGEPIVAARCERIEENGGSSFREYMLPEAVLKFRQGFGRLIRSRSDRGIAVIADPRLSGKNYGRSFLKALPVTVHTISSPAELAGVARMFFA